MRFARRLFATLRSRRTERELEREIAAHLVLLEEEHLRRGVSPDEARRAARLALGGVEQTKELHLSGHPHARARHRRTPPSSASSTR